MNQQEGTHDKLKTASVLNQVFAEREEQHKKWGQQNHPGTDYLMILGEEVGEANKEYLEMHFACKTPRPANSGEIVPDFSAYRKELIQVAAVAVAMVETLDRLGH